MPAPFSGSLIQLFRRHWAISFIILSAVVFKTFLFFRKFHPWWDFGVYLGMGKFMFSLGSSGLWEPIRPVLWPAFLGLLWRAGLDPVAYGRLAGILFSAGITLLVYVIAMREYGRLAAVFAGAISAFSSITFFMSLRLYTEVPSAFLLLLSFYLAARQREFISGLMLAFAVLMKFTSIVFAAALLLSFLGGKTRVRRLLYFSAGSGLILVPFMALNQAFYGNFLYPFTEASSIIGSVVGCNVIHYQSWWFYLVRLPLDNIFLIFAIFGGYRAAASRKPFRLSLLAAFLLPFIYFTSLSCRLERYMVVFIPFAAILAGDGLCAVMKKMKLEGYVVAIASITLLVSVSAAFSMAYYESNDIYDENSKSLFYYRYLQGKNSEGEIWTSNPLHAVYSGSRLYGLYYPVYDGSRSAWFLSYLMRNSSKVEYVFLDNCGGGIICRSDDSACIRNLQETIEWLDSNMEPAFKGQSGRCYYLAYRRKAQ